MRHLSGIIFAIVAALAIFFGGSWGYLRLLRVPTAHEAASSLPAAGGSLLHNHHVLFAMAALAAATPLARRQHAQYRGGRTY